MDSAVSTIETWGEWDGAARQDLKAVHAEGIYDQVRICKMNPPVSSLYLRKDAPWPLISAWRLDLAPLGAKNIPQFPCMDPNFVSNLQAEVQKHLGEKYGWSSIATAVGAGIITRIWPWAGKKLLALPTLASPDCSVWWTARLNATVRLTYKMPAFDLFEGDEINDERIRPADFPTSRFLKPLV